MRRHHAEWCMSLGQGQAPTAEALIALRNGLLQSSDLRRVSDLEAQLKSQANLSADASQSLVSLLQVTPFSDYTTNRSSG